MSALLWLRLKYVISTNHKQHIFTFLIMPLCDILLSEHFKVNICLMSGPYIVWGGVMWRNGVDYFVYVNLFLDTSACEKIIMFNPTS